MSEQKSPTATMLGGSVADLKAEAKKLGVKGYSKMNAKLLKEAIAAAKGETTPDTATEEKAATVPAKKEKKTTPAKSAEVLGPDLIQEASKEIEQLTKDDALKLAHDLVEDTDFNYFKLGGVLSSIQANGWWEGKGFETFKDFIEAEYGLQYRKGMYLIAIYNGLVEANVPWDKVKELGWTKLKELSTMLTHDNVDEWVKRAKNMSTIQLIEYIKSEKAGGGTESGTTTTTPSEVSTMTFKVHPDQKETIETAIEKQMADSGTEFKPVALEYICQNYMESTLGKKKKDAGEAPDFATLLKDQDKLEVMKTLFDTSTPEEVMGVFEKVYPNLNVTIEM